MTATMNDLDTYTSFLESKTLIVKPSGKRIEPRELNPAMFPHQRDLVIWAAKQGRGALLEDTGLGKTIQQLEWARVVAERSLILAPLAVARQTVKEGQRFGIPVTYARNQSESPITGITITNYERLDNFDTSLYGAVVLDESSILANCDGKTRNSIIKAFRDTPYKLACTATPIPNDIREIGGHAEFLGIMTEQEMLAAFFVHDDNGWRLNKHAAAGPFWEWLASWSMAIRKPSDLGYDDTGYDLPGLKILPSMVQSDYIPEGKLFHDSLKGVTERAEVRKATLEARVERAVELVNEQPDQQWLLWHGLNLEGDALLKALPGSVLVEGSQSPEEKAEALEAFARGDIRILITKPSIAGMGMNFQNCARMAFVGLSDSYKDYYQSIRRCYRFKQTQMVEAHIVLSDVEDTIFQNVLRKEREAAELVSELIKHVSKYEIANLGKSEKSSKMEYQTKDVTGHSYRLMLGDSAERMQELPSRSIDFSVFSQPFQDLYTYSNTERDLGNCKTADEFWQHFSFINRQLLRVMRPGRIVAAHVQQIATQKAKDGYIGMRDFRGETIAHFTGLGFIYQGEVCIDKDPQAQAIRLRGRAKGLRFSQKDKDRSWLRPAMADYILVFRTPGENTVPIVGDVSNEQWIEWARPIWYGIDEGNTLNAAEARGDDDERHICPLQLGTIERCIRLWSNPGETVFDPFNGIGSTGYVAIENNRKYIGIELNPNYFNTAVKNVQRAEMLSRQEDLFTMHGVEVA